MVKKFKYETTGFGSAEVSAIGGAFDSAKNHKRQRRKRQSVTAKREKSQTPKFALVRLGQVRLSSVRLS